MNEKQESVNRFNVEADARLRAVFGPARVMVKVHPQGEDKDTSILFMLPTNCASLTARQAKAIGEELLRAGSCADQYSEDTKHDEVSA